MIANAEAINEAFDLALASRYAMTSMRHNDTSSRPPTDLRGSFCGIRYFGKERYKRSYDAGATGSLEYSRTGDAWQIRCELTLETMGWLLLFQQEPAYYCDVNVKIFSWR